MDFATYRIIVCNLQRDLRRILHNDLVKDELTSLARSPLFPAFEKQLRISFETDLIIVNGIILVCHVPEPTAVLIHVNWPSLTVTLALQSALSINA